MATHEVTLRYERRALADIKEHPANPNVHPERQARALRSIIEKVGIADVIIVNERTGFCIDGHLRLAEARRNGETDVDVAVVDLDPDLERVALGTIDPIGRLVRANPTMQTNLLRKLPDDAVPASVRPANLESARAALEKATRPKEAKEGEREPKGKAEVIRRPQRVRVLGFDSDADRVAWITWVAQLSPDLGSTQGSRVIGYLARAKEAGLW